MSSFGWDAEPWLKFLILKATALVFSFWNDFEIQLWKLMKMDSLFKCLRYYRVSSSSLCVKSTKTTRTTGFSGEFYCSISISEILHLDKVETPGEIYQAE